VNPARKANKVKLARKANKALRDRRGSKALKDPKALREKACPRIVSRLIKLPYGTAVHGCVATFLLALRVRKDRKAHQESKDLQAPRVNPAHKVKLARKANKALRDRRENKAPKDHRENKALKDPKALRDHRGSRVPKDHKVFRERVCPRAALPVRSPNGMAASGFVSALAQFPAGRFPGIPAPRLAHISWVRPTIRHWNSK
jgi:hypothetical protein